MPHKQDVLLAAIGTTMGVAPSIVDKPFYESSMWLGSVAIAGMTLLVLSAINAAIRLAIIVRRSKKMKLMNDDN